MKLEEIRSLFPVLQQKVYGHDLVYLDSAATSLKPQSVINSVCEYYSQYSSNVHRGIHYLSEQSTIKYENTRELVRSFIGAKDVAEIIFTRGTTESINLVARTFGETLSEGDEVLISHMEHHSNIVPWQLLRERKGIIIKIIPVTDIGEIDLESYEELLTSKVKLVAITAASNTLGTVTPLMKMIQSAHNVGAKVLVDAAQAVGHFELNVTELDCDFLAFSAHKMYGPTGVGALYGKKELLESLPPFHGGGDMIDQVSFEKTTYNDLPYRLEAGTPAIASTIAWSKAIEFILTIGRDWISQHEKLLSQYCLDRFKEIKGFHLLGEAKNRIGVFSFTLDSIHPQDLISIIDHSGIAIRTGHHCTQPLLKRFNVNATSRISLGVYNNKEDIDRFIESVKKAQELLS